MKNPAPPKNGQKSILSTFLESAEQMEQENRGLLLKFEKSSKLHHPNRNPRDPIFSTQDCDQPKVQGLGSLRDQEIPSRSMST